MLPFSFVRRSLALVTLVGVAGCYDLDALRAAASSRCADQPLQLCEGFETGVLAPRWTPALLPPTTVTIDDSFAYRGTHSLRIDGPASDSSDVQGEITEHDTFPASDFFMRAFLYLPADTPPTPIRIMTPFQEMPPYGGVEFIVAPTSSGFAPRIFDTIGNHGYDTLMPSFNTDGWACLEWEMVVGAPGQVRVWVNDVEYTDLALSFDTMSSPPFGTLAFGMLHPGGTPAHSIWLDELAVDSQRITCAR